jgi:hypothetical protein
VSYLVSTWDHDEQEWIPFALAVSVWGLRPVILELRSQGWSEMSTLIRRWEGDRA